MNVRPRIVWMTYIWTNFAVINKFPILKGRCNLCGCGLSHAKSIFNKIAIATTSCPKGLWRSDIEIDVADIEKRKVELFNEWTEIQKKEYPVQDGKSCTCQ